MTKRGSKFVVFHPKCRAPFYMTIYGTNDIRMPGTQEKKGARTFMGPGRAGHSVFVFVIVSVLMFDVGFFDSYLPARFFDTFA